MTALHQDQLLALRPEITTEPADSVPEQFQNQTLRPILKLQNELLIRIFRQYISKHKDVFRRQSIAEQQAYIVKSLRQDPHLRHFLRGIISGHFTENEWQQFEEHEEEINKRMMKLIEQRLISQQAVI